MRRTSARLSDLPRFISAASIEIGDLVRVSWKVKDIQITRTARVHKRDYEGGMRVFTTEQGEELFRWHPDHDREFKITLIEKAPPPPSDALFDIDEVRERVS